eukprot:CAMPEP_0184658702 /NCGR_PEP_ID=MMETSP0308-20130426/26548_1 /TAXON_ID=38269 /ORGANISM="Gloeochaete witrockiana, Strain SAG 46.84" /LENGTH=376 /DNA_ID=CAMNT_0027097891 /DNA_START=348 /DNA_END=1478 /DNA_ORIENTATION=-
MFFSSPPILNQTQSQTGLISYKLWEDTKRVGRGVFAARYLYAYPGANGLIKYAVAATSSPFLVWTPYKLFLNFSGDSNRRFYVGDTGVISWNAGDVPIPPSPLDGSDPWSSNDPFDDWFYTIAVYPASVQKPYLNDLIAFQDFYILDTYEINSGSRDFISFINTSPDLERIRYRAHYIFAYRKGEEFEYVSLAQSRPFTFIGPPGGKGCDKVHVVDKTRPLRISIECTPTAVLLYLPQNSAFDEPGAWNVTDIHGKVVAHGKGYTDSDMLQVALRFPPSASLRYSFSIAPSAYKPRDIVTGSFILRASLKHAVSAPSTVHSKSASARPVSFKAEGSVSRKKETVSLKKETVSSRSTRHLEKPSSPMMRRKLRANQR